MDGVPLTLDLAAVVVFALTGALVASRAQLDPVGFMFLASLTAVGGGTIRDLLLARAIFWVAAPIYLAVACTAAIVVFFAAHLLESRYKVLVWLDAVALAVAVAAGLFAATQMGSSPAICLVMGILTGCLGGLMRDVVANEVPLVLKQGQLYVTAAFAGALVGVAALEVGADGAVAGTLCIAVTFTLRAGAILYGWHLPGYKPRPPRYK
ncbi:MAG: trimeric intracellular cation channel family protein [Rhodobacteraceae bacterium]|nr:trimeric intracellular cation channel family protein [Paracoccaceae bacterium]